MAKEIDYCWEVKHPDYGLAVVIAPDWERATVAAAEFWGVRWPKVAWGCTKGAVREARRSVCPRCGKVMFNQPMNVCEACKKIIRTENEQMKANLQKTWHLGKKTEAWGT